MPHLWKNRPRFQELQALQGGAFREDCTHESEHINAELPRRAGFIDLPLPINCIKKIQNLTLTKILTSKIC
jgi:hypothetical protein